MYPFVLTYDLQSSCPDPHTPFLKQAAHLGLYTWIEANGEMCKLPNTTLTGTFASREAAVAAFDQALRNTEWEINAKVTLTARYVVQKTGQGLIDPKSKHPIQSLAAAFAQPFGLQRLGAGTSLLSRM